jgi:hypothetical protein
MEAHMYGVRIMIDGQIADVRIFGTLSAAQERFEQGWAETYDGFFDNIAIFSVRDAKDVRDAASAIRNGMKDRIELVAIQESQDIAIARLAKKIEVNL